MEFNPNIEIKFQRLDLNRIISYLNRTSVLILLLFLFFLFFPTNLYQNDVDEKDLIIAYIERFTRFITNDVYPEFDNQNLPFNIYVYGENTFGNGLENAYNKQKIKNRTVKIFYVDKIENIKNANLIYINTSSKSELQKLIDFANQKGILTISYTKGNADKGVHINLYKKDNRLRFEINLKSSQSAGFIISHLLLSNAKIVE